jgi:spermidine/putrescine transport system ATP-binding protein
MLTELKQIQRSSQNMAFVLVTHDQEEALSVSDRVVVMNEGKIRQTGTPKEVYEDPVDLFTAKFVGDTNLFEATATGDEQINGTIEADVAGFKCKVTSKNKIIKKGDRFTLLLRPEDMRPEKLTDMPNTAGRLVGKVELQTYKGATVDTVIILDNEAKDRIKVSEFFNEDEESIDYVVGETVSVGWVEGWEVVLIDDGEPKNLYSQ